MHLYAQDFDERETFDNKLALHPSVLAVAWIEDGNLEDHPGTCKGWITMVIVVVP